MKISRIIALVALIAASALALHAALAQQPGIKRTDLQRHDLSVPGREVIQVLVEFAPGVSFPRHSHPGEEIVYVVEGSLEYQLDGKPPVTLKAGEVLFIPDGASPRGQERGQRQRGGARHVHRGERESRSLRQPSERPARRPQSRHRKARDATMKSAHDSPILVTGAAGDIGAIGRNLTAMLLAKGHKVRALVRREDERSEGLRRLGAEVVQGDLTDLTSMHRAIEGCARIYFGMSVSAAYLEATVNTAAVARHHGVEAFVNMSQMTVTQMSITETTDSPQHKLHWLAEQALAWSGLPVVTVRPTVFLESFFLRLAAAGVREGDELALPLGSSRTSPISAVDVARAVSVILDDPAPHIGHVYNLTGFESADLDHYARVFSEALGRTIRYRNVPLSGWTDRLREAGVPTHLVNHLAVMADLHAQGRYDRMTDDLIKLTGKTPTSMHDFVKLHAAEFTRREATA